jgi:Na+-transporting NADH:ubiquinone oxidoreductase subunit C
MAYSNKYIFGFASLICVVCSLSVAATATGLKDIQDLNKERDLRNNILQALGLVEEGQSILGEEIDALWTSRVNIAFVDATGGAIPAGDVAYDLDEDGDVDGEDVRLARVAAKGTTDTPAVLAVYQRLDGEQVVAHGIPVYGNGLWGPLSGYLAVDGTGSEITGATFFAPKETPGLGAEIMAPAFKAQWTGKKVVKNGASEPVRVAKGKVADVHPDASDYYVDGVSGATITCRGVTAMLEEGIAFYDPYLSLLRTP